MTVSESLDVEVGAMGTSAEAEVTPEFTVGAAEVPEESATRGKPAAVSGCTSVDVDCVVSLLDAGCGAA